MITHAQYEGNFRQHRRLPHHGLLWAPCGNAIVGEIGYQRDPWVRWTCASVSPRLCKQILNPRNHICSALVEKKVNATPPELQPVNPFVNLIDVIAAPATAFRRISTVQRRSWWLPALLCLLSALLYLAVALNATLAEAAKQIQIQLSAMPADQVEAARPMMERFTTPIFIFGTGAVTITLGLLLGWTLATGMLYFGASLTGHALPASAAWALAVWTWLPFALRSLFQAAWSAVNSGDLIRYPGLSYLLATGDITADQRTLLYVAASQIDLFTLWHLVLVYVVVRVVARMGTMSALVFTLVYGLINLGLRLLPALAGGALGAG